MSRKMIVYSVIKALVTFLISVLVAIMLSNMAYRSKYGLTSNTSLNEDQVRKLHNGLKREIDWQWFCGFIPWALLLGFAVLAIVVLISQGIGR